MTGSRRAGDLRDVLDQPQPRDPRRRLLPAGHQRAPAHSASTASTARPPGRAHPRRCRSRSHPSGLPPPAGPVRPLACALPRPPPQRPPPRPAAHTPARATASTSDRTRQQAAHPPPRPHCPHCRPPSARHRPPAARHRVVSPVPATSATGHTLIHTRPPSRNQVTRTPNKPPTNHKQTHNRPPDTTTPPGPNHHNHPTHHKQPPPLRPTRPATPHRALTNIPGPQQSTAGTEPISVRITTNLGEGSGGARWGRRAERSAASRPRQSPS